MSAAIDLVASEFVVLAIGCFFILRYYAASMVTFDVFVSVYISWVLGSAGVLFLPYDLSLAIVSNEHSAFLERVWRFVYWSTFFLAWVILPIQMEYHGSGHFSFKEKMKDAIYRLLFTGAIAILAAIIYIIYMVSTSGGTFSEVIGFVMAMGNTYGVLLITLLMGNGLVALPMHLWRLGDVERGLQELYLSASYVEETFQDARYELEDCEVEVEKIIEVLDRSGSAALRDEIGPLVAILKEKISNFQFHARSKSRAYVRSFQTESVSDDVLVSIDYLIKLHARLMISQAKARASERRWNVLLIECDRQEKIRLLKEQHRSLTQEGWCALLSSVPVDGSTTSSNESSSSPTPASASVSSYFSSICSPWTWRAPRFCQPYCTNLYVIWSQRLYTHACRAAAVLCGAMSILVLWCELLMSSHVDSPIGLLMTAYSYQQSNSIMVQAVAFVALMYMSMCTYWPLFRLNIGWTYQLQGPQQSSPFSLIFNAEYLSRLQFTIGYNFLMYLNVRKTDTTAFNQLMKKIDLIPVFGTSFAVYIPLIMVIVALLTFFDGFSRLIALIGIEWEDNTSTTSSSTGSNSSICCNNTTTSEKENTMNPVLLEKIRTGKLIVGNELKQRQLAAQANNNTKSSNNYNNLATTTTSNNRKSDSVTSKMRIGMSDITQMTHFTEALIPTPQPRYRHLDTTSATTSSHQDNYDIDIEIPDTSASSSSPYNLHYSPYSPGNRNFASSTAEEIEIEKQRHSLFSYTGTTGRNKTTTTNTTSSSGTRNPIAATSTSSATRRDLFSIDNDDDDVYTGRYSDV